VDVAVGLQKELEEYAEKYFIEHPEEKKELIIYRSIPGICIILSDNK